ncbi:MAG: sterol desaturase family protein [Planctomycetota bacterium]|nr:sterol desaturase family protein [Planctomycetota bacterium]
MLRAYLGLLIVLPLLGLVFSLLARRWPAAPGQAVFRRLWRTDLAYWLLSPVLARGATHAALVVVLVPLVLLLYRTLDDAQLTGFGPLAAQPLALQAIEVLLLGDFAGYWSHRLFHRRRLWRFHAVHHSAEELDWLASARVHPLNEIISRVLAAVPLVSLGFHPKVLAGYAPFLTFYAVFLHANLRWDFGPLRAVLASPAFHRWHHSREPEARDKNFAGFFPVWDVIFGTYHLPRGRWPVDLGVDDAVPAGIWRQLAFPFQAKPPTEQPGA